MAVVCFFMPNISFGQTNSEAISFLKTYAFEWSCQKYAEGVFLERLNFSLIKDQDINYLEIKIKRDEIYKLVDPGGYTITKINLSKITRVEVTNETTTDCRKVLIHTKPYGIETKIIGNDGEIIVTANKLNGFYEKFGWKDDAIFIIGDISRNNRIIKSLEFLATSSGAQLQKSSF